MNLKYHILLVIALLVMAISGIVPEEERLDYPDHFPAPSYDFSKNSLTQEKIMLGRHLFYDPILSKDLTISCASCHSPYNAFAHTDHDLSHGINDEIGTRNAPALFNLAWQKTFMWDGAVNHLDMQALAPISHPQEMGDDINSVIQKLRAKEQYKVLFYQAFADSSVTGEHLLKALSQFQLTLVSAGAKYDQVKQGMDSFSGQEQRGYELFQQHCNTCHTEPLFSNYTFEDNGLSVDTTLNDYGRGAITQKPRDSLLFKIPSLRNLSYTYPYMHDGRFSKLNQVLQHYDEEVIHRKTLAKTLAQPLLLGTNDKTDLIAFLLTLNDQAFVFHPDHQYPRN